MLSEISQTEKDKYHRYHMFSLMWILRNLTEDHGGGEGKKKELPTEREGGRQTIRDS